MPTALSVIIKQQLAKESNSPLKWIDLDSRDRKIVMAVCFTDSVENARKSMKLSIGGFYKRWKYLKPIYKTLLDDLPNHAITILKAQSVQAAQTLGRNLEAENPSDQIKAANSILDRVTTEREQASKGSYRKMTVEEFIMGPKPETEE